MVRIDLKEKSATADTDLDAVLAKQKTVFNARPNPPWSERKANLQKLGKAIEEHEAEFQKAISEDFGNRAYEETTIAEIMIIKGGISHALKHTKHWMRTRRATTAIHISPPATLSSRSRLALSELSARGITPCSSRLCPLSARSARATAR